MSAAFSLSPPPSSRPFRQTPPMEQFVEQMSAAHSLSPPPSPTHFDKPHPRKSLSSRAAAQLVCRLHLPPPISTNPTRGTVCRHTPRCTRDSISDLYIFTIYILIWWLRGWLAAPHAEMLILYNRSPKNRPYPTYWLWNFSFNYRLRNQNANPETRDIVQALGSGQQWSVCVLLADQ